MCAKRVGKARCQSYPRSCACQSRSSSSRSCAKRQYLTDHSRPSVRPRSLAVPTRRAGCKSIFPENADFRFQRLFITPRAVKPLRLHPQTLRSCGTPITHTHTKKPALTGKDHPCPSCRRRFQRSCIVSAGACTPLCTCCTANEARFSSSSSPFCGTQVWSVRRNQLACGRNGACLFGERGERGKVSAGGCFF